MTEFDFSPGQKAFVMGLWGGSLLITAALVLWDFITGRNRVR